MSRSRKHQPFFYCYGNTYRTAVYKADVNRMMRRSVRQLLPFGIEPELLPQTLDQVEDIWCSRMDGKKSWANPAWGWVKKMMRKK